MSDTVTQTSPETLTGLAAVDALLQPFNRCDAPGLVVGIARDGRTIYRHAVGMASIEHGVANTPRTRVRIASTSKHFTALAVLLLAEDGRLDIDDAVHRHLPELPALSPAAPTLRQLMRHTGGFRTDLGGISHGFAIEPTPDWTAPVQAVPRELNFEPGSRMIYSNGGYQLLARVIERVGGQRFETFLRERIFAPLGMRETESVTSDFDLRPGVASQYQALPESAGGGLRRGIYPGELRGSGSLVSSIDDMLRWLAHMRSAEKTVGSAASWARMLEPSTLSTGTVVSYGLGLMRHPYRGVEVVHHAGAVLGATSQMITVPRHALDVMIMANGASVSPTVLGFRIIDALLGDALAEPPIERVPTTRHPALPGKRYHAPATGMVIGFEDVAGALGLSLLGSRAFVLRQGDDHVALACEDIALNPVSIQTADLAGDTAPAALTLNEGGHLLHCHRLPDEAPTLAALAAELTGRYRAPDLDADAHIELRAGELSLRLQGLHGRNAFGLQALSADVLLAVPLDPLAAAMGGSGILNIDRDAGRVVGLRFDSPRTRHLRFGRQPSEAGIAGKLHG